MDPKSLQNMLLFGDLLHVGMPKLSDTMSSDELQAAACKMERQGGGFASAIANAFFRADSSNREKLLSAFPELFIKYAD